MRVFVDIPTLGPYFQSVKIFKGPDAKKKALEYVKKRWGADSQGRINLLTIDENDEETYLPMEKKKDVPKPA